MSKLETEKISKFRSLSVALAIAFLALSAVVLLIVGSLNMYLNFQNQRKVITSQQQLIARNAANTVKGFIQAKYGLLETIASYSDLVTAPQEEQTLILRKLLGLEPSFRQLVLLNAQGQALQRISRISKLLASQLMEYDQSELFSKVSQKETYISSVYIDKISSEPMVIMAVPVTDVFADFKGILVAEANLKFMWDLVGRMKIGKNGLAYVVNKQGNLIAFGDISRVLKGENLSYLDEVKEVIYGSEAMYEGKAEVSKGILGTYVLTTHEYLGMPDWAVVVELPIAEAYKTIIDALKVSGFIMLLSFVLAIVIGINLSKKITKPIISLREAAIKIGEGNLDTQIKIKTRDEIGDLAQAFNQMTQDLQRTTTSIDNLNREIAQRKKAEQALRQAEERYRMQFEGALDAILVADAQTGIILDCNPAAARLVGRERSELIGQHQRILHPPEDSEGEFSETFKQHLQEKRGQTIETDVITKTGQIKNVAITANLIEIAGKEVMQGIFRDITEHKKAEEQQKRLMKDLEDLNKIMTGRELRMIELKQEVNKLSEELGRSAPYGVSA
jgi:PAS domain S-box-containing protein